jgi:hypothetical protein
MYIIFGRVYDMGMEEVVMRGIHLGEAVFTGVYGLILNAIFSIKNIFFIKKFEKYVIIIFREEVKKNEKKKAYER